MTIERAVQNLTEIVELSDEEINNNNENASAVLDLEDIKSLKMVLEELKKKDKIINEMANNILKFRADTILPTDTEGIKQYFKKKVEE